MPFRSLKNFVSRLNPKPALERGFFTARTQAGLFQYFGGGLFVLGAVGCLWGLQGNMFPEAPPSKAINVADFSRQDLSGTLNEVLLDGYLHPTAMLSVTISETKDVSDSSSPAVIQFDLMPLAEKNWTYGDPVKVFAFFGYTKKERTFEDWETLFEQEGLVLDDSGKIKIHKLMAESTIAGLDRNTTFIVPESPESDGNVSNGMAVDFDNLAILKIIEGRRDTLLKNHFDFFQNNGAVLAVLGAVVFGMGYTIKKYP